MTPSPARGREAAAAAAAAGAARAPDPLGGHAVLIVGHGHRLAYSLAAGAVAQGARVALAVPAGDSSEIGDTPSLTCVAAELDGEEGADALLDVVVARLGPMHVVFEIVAAVGVGELHLLPPDRWCARVVDPLRRSFRLARRVVEDWLAGGHGGRWVFVVVPAGSDGSGIAVLGEAVAALTRSLAREYGSRGIACNAVVLRSSGGRRGGAIDPGEDPQGSADLIDAALFLGTTDAAAFVTGDVLQVGPAAEPGSELVGEDDDR